jgi:hypothetical protein
MSASIPARGEAELPRGKRELTTAADMFPVSGYFD